jgi:glycosyltransferase involved in cell wall biosynthesis
MANSLYICYFGLLEPLVQTQVLPYLRELVKDDHRLVLLTFEPDAEALEKAGISDLTTELSEQGIKWVSLPYHKRFSAIATAWDILRGTLLIRRLIVEEDLDVLHGRVHVPTLMGALARRSSRRRPKLLFDVRGFFPEEYTDAGVWPDNGLLYRSAKWAERWLMKEADGFVVLTEKARDILFPAAQDGHDVRGRPVEVIPCCVDLGRIPSAGTDTRSEMREKLGLGDRFVMAYVGSFGGWYLTKETVDFLASLKASRPDTFALILTQSKPELIEPLLKQHGYLETDYLVKRVSPAEIPAFLSAADAAVSFIKNCYSKQASSPTKNAEYLASGLPIVVNAGIGDVDSLVDKHKVGVLVHDLSPAGYEKAINEILGFKSPAGHIREVAAQEFALDAVGGARYRRLYSRLLSA